MRDRIKESARETQAFTLHELILVAGIIGLMASIALPRIGNAIGRQRANAAAKRIVLDLKLAQRQAKTTGKPQSVQFYPNGYELVNMPHPDHSGLSYRVDLYDEPYGAQTVSINFGGDLELIFDLYGRPDSDGSVVVQVGTDLRTVSVDPDTGEASIQ